MISRKMNKFIHTIHKMQVIVYKKNKDYYVIDNDIYILRSLLKFSYCYKNNRKVIFIDNDYINYGYDRVLEYKAINNRYNSYYMKGKRIVKNERKVKCIVDTLNRYKDIKLLKEVSLIINDG